MGLLDLIGHKYPFTDFHELNLDWCITAILQLQKAFEDFSAGNKIVFANPLQHDLTKTYAKNTIVVDPVSGTAYLSLDVVPVGVQLDNTDYWLPVFDFASYVTRANQNFTDNYFSGTDRTPIPLVVGDWVVLDDVLYKVTAAMAADDLFIIGTNIVHFTVEQFLKDFITSVNQTINDWHNQMVGLINQYKNDIDTSEYNYRMQLAGDIANTTSSLQAQLDAAISGATVDSEVINARVGWDNTTYNTLRDSIVGQMAQALKTHHEINSVNLSTYIPTAKLSDMTINTITYFTDTAAALLSDCPTTGNFLLVYYSGYGSNTNYGKYQHLYDITSKLVYDRYSGDGVTWTSWKVDRPLKTYHEIASGNISTYLPTAKLADLPVNSITYFSPNSGTLDAPSQNAAIVVYYSGFANLNYGLYQTFYEPVTRKTYSRYSADKVTWDSWKCDMDFVLKTYHEINSGNISTYLPTAKLADLPVNSITYISANSGILDSPSDNAIVVLTYSGYLNLLFARYQVIYDTITKRKFTRWSADGNTWKNWAPDYGTFINIDSSNYSEYLPTQKLADIAVNSIAYIAIDAAVTDGPVPGSNYVVETMSGYGNLLYAKLQRAYCIVNNQTYTRYSADGVTWTDWSTYGSYKDILAEKYVQTVINKPIELKSGKGLFIFGDSIATDTHGGFTWGSLIASRTGCTEYNYAIGGSAFTGTANASIAYQLTQVSDWSPCDVVIVAAGTNEHLFGTVTPSALKTAVENVISTIRTNAPNADIIFITPLKCVNYRAYQEIDVSRLIMNVAMYNECSVISGGDIPILLTQDDDSWTVPFDDGDNLHPNAKGKWVYAASVLNAIL